VRSTLIAGGFPPERVFVVLNGINPSVWHSGIGGALIREELGLGADDPMLLTVCRMISGKGVDDLIRTLPTVRRAFPNARLVSVGFEQFPGFLDVLYALAAELGVTDAVTFAGWRSDIPAFLDACDVFGLPSHGEPFGLAYLEAMAMEKPVVGYFSGATPEVVVDQETGYLVAEGDIDGLGRRIVDLLYDPGLRQSMGKAGRARLSSEFTLAQMAASAAAVYRHLVNGMTQSDCRAAMGRGWRRRG
jgi:phosphatidyl-myo-inositol dimannoside synthase